MYFKNVSPASGSGSLKKSQGFLKNWKSEKNNKTNNNDQINNVTLKLSEINNLNNSIKNNNYLLFKSNDIWSASNTISSVGGSSRRNKRSVVHLFNMVLCATGCNPLAFKGYGCFCGFLGSGYPVDGIDRCCWIHDRCYDATGCPTFIEYFVPYYWKCYRGSRPICAISHGSWGGSGSCSQRLCECDRALSQCLSRFPCPQTKAVCTSAPFRFIQNIFMML
ncbi:hypothetical protein HCN44_006621 [Aphidius gifuensis]|uniref:Phospholipase A2 n=1 Tax=Aphidius gifuensis TaxID=684658 RepID=A0A834Y1V6_APHGI|nr:acidic phospholipase A2 2 isoform X2 [Aphidius gifuensis]KAF7995514.1 hypothetical protein HCN44_006621 [Aphidius gifuensis]